MGPHQLGIGKFLARLPGSWRSAKEAKFIAK